MRNALLTSIILVLFAVTLVPAEKIELGAEGDFVNLVVQDSIDLRTVVRFDYHPRRCHGAHRGTVG